MQWGFFFAIMAKLVQKKSLIASSTSNQASIPLTIHNKGHWEQTQLGSQHLLMLGRKTRDFSHGM